VSTLGTRNWWLSGHIHVNATLSLLLRMLLIPPASLMAECRFGVLSRWRSKYRPRASIRKPSCSMRVPERSDDDRRRSADLPDDELPTPRHPACRQLVRAGRARQHLHPHHEPDESRPRRTRRGSRGRGRRTGTRFWLGRLAVCDPEHLLGGRTISSARPTSTAAPGTCFSTRW